VRVDFSIDSTSKSWIIANNSAASTLRIILLHFIDDQCKIFACVASAKQMTWSICENKSRLFAKDEFVKITKRRDDWFSLTYLRSLIWLIICHCKRLFKMLMSFYDISVDWTAWDKSNDASDWHINVK
jgi:hypothetical protein